jgi:hypothetical protein
MADMKQLGLVAGGLALVLGGGLLVARWQSAAPASPPPAPLTPPRITLPEQCDRALSFADYAVPDRYDGPVAAVDLSTPPEAAEFRTVIATADRQGVNFAGRYTVASWGCGTSCQSSTIVDAATGRIVHFGLVSTAGVSYRADSALLVVNPSENLPAGYPLPLSTEYYLLRDGQLEFACRVPATR